jgi:hypothetical protein
MTIALTIKNSINDMNIGDCIACRYTASSAAAGIFSELGTSIVDEIPVAGTAAPDGLFYFIKVDKGILIADRVIQTSISWDALNGAGYIEGAISKTYDKKVSPTMTSATAPSPYVVTASNFEWYNGSWGYEGYRAFSSNRWSTTASPPSGGHWLKIFMGSPTRIESMLLQGYCSAWFNSSIRNWALYGSNNDIDYTLVTSALYPNLGGSSIGAPYSATKYTFSPATYSYYKIVLSNGYQAASAVGIYSIGFCINVNSIGNNIKIRSLTGGNAYLNTDGKSSLIDNEIGAYPNNNEWDKYIVNSSLNGKITPGDDSIWNWNLVAGSWCKDSSILNLQNDPTHLATNLSRSRRGINGAALITIKGMGYNAYSMVLPSIGFRPVLEYPDDSRCTNSWY